MKRLWHRFRSQGNVETNYAIFISKCFVGAFSDGGSGDYPPFQFPPNEKGFLHKREISESRRD